MLKLGDVVTDDSGHIGVVCIKYADGDLAITENDIGHPNPRLCGEEDLTRFTGNKSFREMIREALNE